MYRAAIYLAFSFCLLLAACSPDPPSPEDIVSDYIAALAAYDFDRATSMSTQRNAAYLDALATVIGDDPPSQDSAWVVIEAIACEPIEEVILCMTIERDPYESSEKEYYLVKNGDSWLIDQPIEEGQIEYGEE